MFVLEGCVEGSQLGGESDRGEVWGAMEEASYVQLFLIALKGPPFLSRLLPQYSFPLPSSNERWISETSFRLHGWHTKGKMTDCWITQGCFFSSDADRPIGNMLFPRIYSMYFLVIGIKVKVATQSYGAL